MSSLQRFLDAQADPDSGFEIARRELAGGHKRSHWIWHILPQLAGLGSSPMAVRFGLDGVSEAAAYIDHPILRSRLAAVTTHVAGALRHQPPIRLVDLMGSEIDARKVVSSMTLFREVARRRETVSPDETVRRLMIDADAILRVAAAQGLPECAFTHRALGTEEI